MAYRSSVRIAADDYCSSIQLNRHFGMDGNTLIAECLGCSERDDTWIAPDGRDCTGLCDRSATGGFDSREPWTLSGWILSVESMNKLKAEFPSEFAKPQKGVSKS